MNCFAAKPAVVGTTIADFSGQRYRGVLGNITNSGAAIVSNPGFRFETDSGHDDVHWSLKRNCSVTPAQLGWMYVSLCVVSLAIGVFFWFRGATLILPFAWLELAAVGISFFVYARHATDGERISLRGQKLVIELENAGRLERAEFDRDWVRIEPGAADTSLIEVSGRGRSIQIGRYVRPELRPALARELRMVLLNRRPEAVAPVVAA